MARRARQHGLRFDPLEKSYTLVNSSVVHIHGRDAHTLITRGAADSSTTIARCPRLDGGGASTAELHRDDHERDDDSGPAKRILPHDHLQQIAPRTSISRPGGRLQRRSQDCLPINCPPTGNASSMRLTLRRIDFLRRGRHSALIDKWSKSTSVIRISRAGDVVGRSPRAVRAVAARVPDPDSSFRATGAACPSSRLILAAPPEST